METVVKSPKSPKNAVDWQNTQKRGKTTKNAVKRGSPIYPVPEKKTNIIYPIKKGVNFRNIYSISYLLILDLCFDESF